MKCLKKVAFSLGLFISVFTSASALTIKEQTTDFNGNAYIMGSTRFSSDEIVTAPKIYQAGVNESKLYNALGKDLDDIPTDVYYYNSDFGKWYDLQEDGTKVLPDDKATEIENNLNIFFINNKEKILEFNYDGSVDAGSLTEGVVYEDAKFKVPATTFEFSFTSNGIKADVDTKTLTQNSDKLDYGNFEAKLYPKLQFNELEEMYVNTPTEFSVQVSANDYAGEKVLGKIDVDPSVVSKIEYKLGDNWTEIVDKKSFGPTEGFNLQDETIKFRVTFNTFDTTSKQVADYNLKISVINAENSEIMSSAEKGVKVLASEVLAKVGENYYTKLTKAIIYSSTEKPAILLKDIENLDKTLGVSVKDRNSVLDLNGHTITAAPDIDALMFAYSGTITVKNGNIVTSGAGAGFYAFGGAILNVESDVKVTSEYYGVFIVENGTTLNFNGEIEMTKGGYAILGNGNKENAGTIINVGENAIITSTVEGGFAFYLPQYGEVNINGGNITADTVIGIKSGILNINGGTLKAVGEKLDPKEWSNGIIKTGDVIIAEENNAYVGNMEINISDKAKLTSTNGNIIQYYIVDEKNKDGSVRPSLVVTGPHDPVVTRRNSAATPNA